MKRSLPLCLTLCTTLLAGALTVRAQLSPGEWPKEEKERLEKMESQSWAPSITSSVEGSGGVISATVSPIAIYAGLQVLKQGGSAADAAATTALTQVTTQLGSVVSYAGIITMLYYEAKSGTVHSLDAGYNSYLNETEPSTIPVADLGALNYGRVPTEGGAKGRETLVPGFMAGIEAMHARFGRLPFSDLFEPAIWYAEHGVVVSPITAAFFGIREKHLSRTEEGQAFIRQAGRDGLPKAGDLFVQRDLAKTLQEVATQGARYMYTGEWSREFVTTIQREGGKVTSEDLARYQPSWNEPYKAAAFGHTIYVNGAPHLGAYTLISGLHLAEARGLQHKGSYWTDPDTFRDLAHITSVVATAPVLSPALAATLKEKGIDLSPAAQLETAYAEALASILPELTASPADNGPHHSNSIVVVDREGNIAALTHTINAVIWGDSGIVVGGIPIPDSAGFQQTVLAAIQPGERVPHPIIDTICFKDDKPVLATASIGASLFPESLRTLVGVLGQNQDLKTVMAAPPLLAIFDPTSAAKPLGQQPATIPEGGYTPEFLARLRATGKELHELPVVQADNLRGIVAAVAINPKNGIRTAAEQAGLIVYSRAE